MGGTKEGWDWLTANSPVPPKPTATANPAVTTLYQFAPWTNVNKALDEVNGKYEPRSEY